MSLNREFTVTVPGSKSMTNRALLLASLAKGKTVLKGALFSNDSRVFVSALQSAGFDVKANEDKKEIIVNNEKGFFVSNNNEQKLPTVYVGSAGTAARFLTARLALSGGCFEVESSEQMRKRPMKPLLLALEKMGVSIEYLNESYCFPFRILGYQDPYENENKPQTVDLNIDESSQFLSALLMAGALCKNGIRIHLTGTRTAKSYVKITEKMMQEFGGSVTRIDENTYEVPAGISYEGRDYQVEPDVSAACYFYSLAAITGSKGKVLHVYEDSMQGDIKFLQAMKQMGCQVYREEDGMVVVGPEKGELKAITIDMSDFSDQTMTMAATSCFAKGMTHIKNVGHIRLQESDRLAGIAKELTRLGVQIEEGQDEIKIYGLKEDETEPVFKSCQIETYEDHRMAMSFGILASQQEGIEILDKECCSKTFEEFFSVLKKAKKQLNEDFSTRVEKSLRKKFRKDIWCKFTKAINEYELVKPNDVIGVCISGGKDSMLMAKLFQELKLHNKFPFEVKFIVMDPGYNENNRAKIEENAGKLNIPVEIYESDIFESVVNIEDSPCYLCARMRRGHLYNFAKQLGCNKIALGHHYDDVIETILMGMLYGAQIQTMMPKLHSTNFEGMELIRPLYLIREEAIKAWRDYNGLEFLQCACRFTEENYGKDAYRRKSEGSTGAKSDKESASKRLEIKNLIAELKKTNPWVEAHIFKSVENVNVDTVICYKKDGEKHHFLERYDDI